MKKGHAKHREFLGALLFIGVVFSALGLQGCQDEQANTGDEALLMNSSAESSPSPFFSPVEPQLGLGDGTVTGLTADQYQPVWGSFPPPSIDPATPIPPPIADLGLSEEVLVWVLLGTDTEPPFVGRTQAIHLLLIHPRFSNASLISIPGDLYVYIPGHTMQRLNTAYALGGIETLRMTLAYNFGVTPSRFVLAHPGDFQWLVDDINGIDVTVFYPIPHACGGIRAGLVRMDGALALCYASHRDGMDEIDRMRRQQQLIRIISHKFSRDGNLIMLPILFASYDGWVKTDLSLAELMDFIPLALRLADPNRIGYYMIGWNQIDLWEVPGFSQAHVFLPDPDSIMEVFQLAIDHVMAPKPLTNQVQTLEAQLTEAVYLRRSPVPTMTATPETTQTFETTGTITPTIGTTLIEGDLSPTPTLTPFGYP